MSVNTTDITYPKSGPGTYLLKRTPRGTKILTFAVLNKILKILDILFDVIEIEAQCSKNYFKISL